MNELLTLDFYKINPKLLNLSHNEKVILSILSSYEDLEELISKIDLSDFLIKSQDSFNYLLNKYPFIRRALSKYKTILKLKSVDGEYVLKGLSQALRKKYNLLSLKETYLINAKTIKLLNKLDISFSNKKEYIPYLKAHIDELFKTQNQQKYLKLYIMSNRDLKFKEAASISVVYEILDDLKIKDIRVYDFENKSPFYDYFVVGTVNEKQANAVASHLKQARCNIRNTESTNDWTLIDLYDIVIHLFSKEARTYYAFDEKMIQVKRIDKNLGDMN
jgi:ribosome-associated protein